MSTTIFVIYAALLNTIKPTFSFGYVDYQYYDKQDDDSIKYKKDFYEYCIRRWLKII